MAFYELRYDRHGTTWARLVMAPALGGESRELWVRIYEWDEIEAEANAVLTEEEEAAIQDEMRGSPGV